jgi:hypothetical protein
LVPELRLIRLCSPIGVVRILTAPFSLYAHWARACAAFGAAGMERGAGEGATTVRAGGAAVRGYWLLEVLGSLERKAEASEWEM